MARSAGTASIQRLMISSITPIHAAVNQQAIQRVQPVPAVFDGGVVVIGWVKDLEEALRDLHCWSGAVGFANEPAGNTQSAAADKLGLLVVEHDQLLNFFNAALMREAGARRNRSFPSQSACRYGLLPRQSAFARSIVLPPNKALPTLLASAATSDKLTSGFSGVVR